MPFVITKQYKQVSKKSVKIPEAAEKFSIKAVNNETALFMQNLMQVGGLVYAAIRYDGKIPDKNTIPV
jgi:hypothetical protein